MKKPENPLEQLPKEVPDYPEDKLLLPYQTGAIELIQSHDLTVIEKSRRIGLTWGVSALAVLTAAAADRDGQNVYYMGYNLEMARDFITVCGEFARSFGQVVAEQGEVLIRDEDKEIRAFRISFASGREILALPSAARVLRGKQGLVLLDEAAFYDDLEEVITAALALLIWGGRVAIISTHFGVDNPFNQLVEEIKSGTGREGGWMKITFDDALNQGLFERIKEITDHTLSKDEWRAKVRSAFTPEAAAEELDCIPSAGSGSWLVPEDIAAAEHADTADPEQYQDGPVYIGWDIARRKDLSVAWVFELVGETLWLRERIEMHKTAFAEQYDAVSDAVRRYRTIRLALDQTGMGEAVTEEMVSRHGSLAEGVILSGPKRLELGTLIKDRFERGLIKIVADPAVRKDLRAIKKTAGATGAPRLVEDGNVHPDIFWAIALACGAAAETVVEYGYETASAGSGGRDLWGARFGTIGDDDQDGWGDDDLSADTLSDWASGGGAF